MKRTFHVPDMECPNCAMHLQGLEDEVDGVRRIDASYQRMSMMVEFDESKVSIQQIIQAANEIGYHPVLKPA
jgi:copper chaperone